MAAGGDAARCPEIPGRCHHCAGPLSKDMETSSWTVPPMVRDSFSMIGSAVGGIAGAFYGFNHTMPVVRRYIKGPMWMHFLVGTPPVIVFSSACAGLAALSGTFVQVNTSLHSRQISPLHTRRLYDCNLSLHTCHMKILTFRGGTIPAAAQLVSSSYHAAMSLPSFARSSHATEPSQSFARSAPHDDMHKARSSSPL
ncbi:unnamed protein product [Urochloa humidicola]